MDKDVNNIPANAEELADIIAEAKKDDIVVTDYDGDGIVDEIGGDTTGDGQIDMVLADTTGDGIVDTMYLDTNGDGIFDTTIDISETDLES